MLTQNNLVHVSRLFLRLQFVHIRAHLEYPLDFAVGIVGGLLRQLTGFVFIWAVLSRVPSVQGWSLWEIAFLYGLFLVPRGLLELFFEGQAKLRVLVNRGNFDWLLVRPVSPVLLVLTQQSNIHGVGTSMLGVLLLARASVQLAIPWDVQHGIFMVLVVLNSVLLLTSLSFAANCIAFWDPGANSSFPFLLNNLAEFVKFPVTLYDAPLRFVLTFVVPLAFVSYFPGTLLLHKPGAVVWQGLTTLLVGPIMAVLAWLAWHRGLMRYQGVGN